MLDAIDRMKSVVGDTEILVKVSGSKSEGGPLGALGFQANEAAYAQHIVFFSPAVTLGQISPIYSNPSSQS